MRCHSDTQAQHSFQLAQLLAMSQKCVQCKIQDRNFTTAMTICVKCTDNAVYIGEYFQ